MMKPMLVGLLSAILALVCYSIYDFINYRWFKSKAFIKTAASLNFPEEVSAFIWRIANGKARQLLTYNKKGEDILVPGLEIIGIKESKLADLKAGLPNEYMTFMTEFDKTKQNIGIIKSHDKFSIIKTMQTQSQKNNINNSRLIAELRSLDRKVPCLISGAAQDWLELFFDDTHLTENMELLMTKAKELCPEISPDTMEEDLRNNHKLFLWWSDDNN